MDKAEMQTAKARFVAGVQAGQPWRETAATTGLHISRSTAYRLLQVSRTKGSTGLQDGRHGHPIKLRGEVRSFLQEHCRQAPNTASSAIQTRLHARFGVSVSVSQINRVRAALGISNHPEHRLQGKKRKPERSFLVSTGVAGGSGEPALVGCGATNGVASPSRVSTLVEFPFFSSISASCSCSTDDRTLSVVDSPLS